MSNVRNAVARRDQAATTATGNGRPPSLALVAKEAIDRQAAVLDAVLPRHVDRGRFSQMVLYAMKQAPDLVRCFETQQGGASFLLAVGQAAIVGLEPNTPTQDCWILPRRASQKNGGHMEAELAIGYRGLLRLARRTGNVLTVAAEVVYESDHFVWKRGLAEDVFEHEPGGEPRGEITHAYAIVRFKDGGYQFAILDRFDLDARRAMSESWKADQRYGNAYSPWSKWPAAMCRKSAIRALAPYLDLTVEAITAISHDEQSLAFDAETGVIDSAATDWAAGELEAAADQPPATEDAPAAPDEPLITSAQSRKLHALLRDVHQVEGDDRFPILSAAVGRQVASTSELSKDEASSIIDALEAEKAADNGPSEYAADDPERPM